MGLLDLAVKLGLYAGTVAFLGFVLVVPLYLSQARDVRRLRQWMELVPDGRAAERQAADAARATAFAAPAAAPAPAPAAAPTPAPTPTPAGTTPVTPIPPAQRVARERPAMARITAERTAVAVPEPWWRRFLRGPDPRVLAGIVAGVVVLAIAVTVLAVQLGGPADEELPRQPGPAAVDPGEVEVTVLNGTAVPGLAAKVGDDVEANGFRLGTVSNSESPYERTAVFFQRGHEQEAQAVARALGVEEVRLIDREIESVAGGATVVVIAGEDRARI